MQKQKILITGGCGKIGAHFAKAHADRYDLRLVDRAAWDAARHGPLDVETLTADLQDLDACRAACQSVDAVIHLAADPDPEADFLGSLLGNNILASYNIFRAAKEAGCRRVIYASSVHAVGSYPFDVQIQDEMPVRPTTFYGVSKCFGEALACHYAVNEGLPSIAIRIGAYLFPDELDLLEPRFLDAYLHPDDFNHLLVQCLETPAIQFLTIPAISNNRYKRLNLSTARQVLGYQPQYDGFTLAGLL